MLAIRPPVPLKDGRSMDDNLSGWAVKTAERQVPKHPEPLDDPKTLARAILDERASEALMGLARDYWQKAEHIQKLWRLLAM